MNGGHKHQYWNNADFGDCYLKVIQMSSTRCGTSSSGVLTQFPDNTCRLINEPYVTNTDTSNSFSRSAAGQTLRLWHFKEA